MNYNNDNEMWDWPNEGYNLGDNANVDVSKCILNGVNETETFSYMLDDGTTPVKDCGDLAYNDSNSETKSMEGLYRETSSQVKRRRMLQFESEILDTPFCNETMPPALLGSQETVESVEDAISEMSEWVSGFAESTSASGTEALDLSSEEWLADCFNDADMHFGLEESNIYGGSDVQVIELDNNAPQSKANVVQERPVRPTPRNIVFKGRKSFMSAPSKSASSVVYPFDFIKPCGIRGDVTLKDINQRIRMPPSKSEKLNEDPSVAYPKSAFSGKPVVGKTKIRTEGGKGCITIMRTKG